MSRRTRSIATLALPGQDATLVDAMEDGPSARAVLAAVVGRTRAAGTGGTIDATPFTDLEVPEGEPRTSAPSTPRRRSATAIATC